MANWREEYTKATAEEDGVLRFLDRLLAEEGGEWLCTSHKKEAAMDRVEVQAATKRLAAVASELIVALPELNTLLNKKEAQKTKVKVLQLQLVCRLLQFGAVKSKQERKQSKKEVRGLLDRVALLLDAANPPSLADEDADERSPFQEFLQQQLAPRLQKLIPGLVKHLLKVYELVEDEEKGDKKADAAATLLPPLLPVVKQSPAPSPVATSNESILSALQQERPQKRTRLETNELFKEVQIPQQLQQKRVSPHERKSRSRSSRSSSSGRSQGAGHGLKRSSSLGVKRSSSGQARSGQDALLRAATETKSERRPGDLSALGMSSPPGSWSKASPGSRVKATMLQKNGRPSSAPALLDRPQAQRTYSSRQHVGQVSTGAAEQARTQSSTTPGGIVGRTALRRAVSTSSVVMRTPDRPKRSAARTTRRVLVEASPPLRKPTGAGTAPQLRRLQSSAARAGGPPPLFR